MKKKITLENVDITLYDLMDVMQKGFARAEEGIEGVKRLEKRVDKIDTHLVEIDTKLFQVERRMGKLEVRFEDMNDTMLEFQESLGAHDVRIVRLEKGVVS